MKEKAKLSIVICIIIVALLTPPVYAFSLGDLVEKIRDALGWQTKPKISADIIIPSQMTTTQTSPSKVELNISNDGSSCNVTITGTVYQNGRQVDTINKKIEIEKKSKVKTEVYSLAPLPNNEGDWKFDLKVVGSNERGTSEDTLSGSISVIAPPKIDAKISKLEKIYSIVKGESKSVTPTVTVSNLGSEATFKVYIETKKNNQVVHTTTKSVQIDKNGETTIDLYTLKLDRPENEGKWKFNVKIEASNDAGKDTEELSAETELIGAPLIKAVRSLDRDKMRRDEELTVTITFENIGYGNAFNVVFEDKLPSSYFSLVKGSKSLKDTIKEGEKKTISYTTKPSKKGDYTFTAVTVYYDGDILKGLTSKTNTNLIQVFGIPELKMTRELSKYEIIKGDSITSTITIYNSGDGIAKSTTLIDVLPSGVSLSSGTSSISKVDIKPGETKTISYTVTAINKGTYTFSSVSASHLDELLDKEYSPKTDSKTLKVYGIPEITYTAQSATTGSLGNVVDETVTIKVSIKNSGDGIAKNLIFSIDQLPNAFIYKSGSSSWSGTLSPGQTKDIEYSTTMDATGTYEIGKALASYTDELYSKSYEEILNPFSFTIKGSLEVISNFEVDFDDSWASSFVPRLGICNTEYRHWLEDYNHRPEWYYRVVLYKYSKSGVIQFFARWPDQGHDWPSEHVYDTEPIWVYFTYSESNWKSATIEELRYTIGHSKVSTYSSSLFGWYDNHPIFRLKDGHHGYDGATLYNTNDIAIYYTDTNVKRLTDKVIREWNAYNNNPFYEEYVGGHGAVRPATFKNPWDFSYYKGEHCFKSSCASYLNLIIGTIDLFDYTDDDGVGEGTIADLW